MSEISANEKKIISTMSRKNSSVEDVFQIIFEGITDDNQENTDIEGDVENYDNCTVTASFDAVFERESTACKAELELSNSVLAAASACSSFSFPSVDVDR